MCDGSWELIASLRLVHGCVLAGAFLLLPEAKQNSEGLVGGREIGLHYYFVLHVIMMFWEFGGRRGRIAKGFWRAKQRVDDT